jgi:tRNA(fMet)-specific endonuclease VapC
MGPEFATLMAHIVQQAPTALAFSIIGMRQEVLGCHTSSSRARTTSEVVRGYRMPTQRLWDFAVSPVLPFNAAAATVFDGLAAQRVRIGRMERRVASIA